MWDSTKKFGVDLNATYPNFGGTTPDHLYYWLTDLLPTGSGIMLDIGIQNHQSVKWFASRGLTVHAVDSESREDNANSPLPNVIWHNDSLPKLSDTYESGKFFDIVVLSNTLNNLPINEREKAFGRVLELLYPGSILAVLYPDANSQEGLTDKPLLNEEIEELIEKNSLSLERVGFSRDFLNPNGFLHHRLCRLDRSIGSKPLEKYIKEERKQSTYKLALLRALYHVTSTIKSSDNYEQFWSDSGGNEICIPAGLVGLYWVKLYKPLLERKFPQLPFRNGTHDPGFFKQEFKKLLEYGHLSLSLGDKVEENIAINLNGAIAKSLQIIKVDPLVYNNLQLCRVTSYKTPRISGTVEINSEYLYEFGNIFVPRYLWDLLLVSNNQLEEKIINEWSKLIRKYADSDINLEKLPAAMHWYD